MGAVQVAGVWADGVMVAVSPHAEGCPERPAGALAMSREMASQYVADARHRGIEVRTCAKCGGLGDDGR